MGKYIKNLYNRDKAVFTALNKCGNLSFKYSLNLLILFLF